MYSVTWSESNLNALYGSNPLNAFREVLGLNALHEPAWEGKDIFM